MYLFLSFTVVCEMCGVSGYISTFFSKSKRFCSTSCARSYSSNSKKSSILARLQVSPQQTTRNDDFFFCREVIGCGIFLMYAILHFGLRLFMNTCWCLFLQLTCFHAKLSFSFKCLLMQKKKYFTPKCFLPVLCVCGLASSHCCKY